MSKTSRTKVRLFPYQYRLSGTENTIPNLISVFDVKNVLNNVITYYAHFSLLLIIDKAEGDFLFGRFLKLRKDAPLILDRMSGKEREIFLTKYEDIEEVSHFVCNVKDSLILAEYNFNAIRCFPTPLKAYLDKKFNVKDNIVIPVEDINTFKKFKDTRKGIKTFSLALAQNKIKELESVLNLSPIRTFFDLSQNNKTQYEITIRKSRGKEQFLDKNKVVMAIEHLKDKQETLESLEIETEDVVYDLIKNNVLAYYIILEKTERTIDKEEFYKKVKEIYSSHAIEIKGFIKPI